MNKGSFSFSLFPLTSSSLDHSATARPDKQSLPCQLPLSRRSGFRPGLRDIYPPELRLLNLFLKIKILNYVQNFRQDNEEAFLNLII